MLLNSLGTRVDLGVAMGVMNNNRFLFIFRISLTQITKTLNKKAQVGVKNSDETWPGEKLTVTVSSDFLLVRLSTLRRPAFARSRHLNRDISGRCTQFLINTLLIQKCNSR